MYKLNVHTPLKCKKFSIHLLGRRRKVKKKETFRRVVQDSPLDCTIRKEFFRLTLSTSFPPRGFKSFTVRLIIV